MHARVQWKVHRRNVIIIVAHFAYATEGRGEREGLKERARIGRGARGTGEE